MRTTGTRPRLFGIAPTTLNRRRRSPSSIYPRLHHWKPGPIDGASYLHNCRRGVLLVLILCALKGEASPYLFAVCYLPIWVR